MKSSSFIILTIVIMLIFSSCSKHPSNTKTDSQFLSEDAQCESNSWNYMSGLTVLVDEGENYAVYSDEQQTGFHYYVKDNHGEILDEGYHDWRGQFRFSNNGDYLTLDYGYGSSEWQRRYYDVEHGKVSRFFLKPIAENKELVAYFSTDDTAEDTVLVIQDIFNPDMLFQTVKRNFSDRVVREGCTADFLDSSNLKITYQQHGDQPPTTEIISIINSNVK